MVESPPSLPRRTCIGCRTRAAKAELIRLVLVEGRLTLDPRGRMPGRGAYVHPDPECLELAERRRAFGRALRTQVPVELAAVRDEFERMTGQQRPGTRPARSEAGREAMSTR